MLIEVIVYDFFISLIKVMPFDFSGHIARSFFASVLLGPHFQRELKHTPLPTPHDQI